jgi:transposase InsO family protein
MSDELHRYLLEHGIEYEISVPYTPQQNGIAERSNRTVAEMSVAMMIAAVMPKFLWPYAVMSAVDILNVLPTRATNMLTTPYIMVYGHIPDVSHLRTLGCDAFAYLQEHKRDSYGARAVKGIHLGKDPHSLGYLFFNIETRQTYVTGHITFNEDLSSKSVESADDYATFQTLAT